MEQSFLLQCIATRDAAALLVHSIGDPAMELKIPPEPTSHVLTVRTATTKQMEEVRAAFDQMNRMCVAPAAARPVR